MQFGRLLVSNAREAHTCLHCDREIEAGESHPVMSYAGKNKEGAHFWVNRRVHWDCLHEYCIGVIEKRPPANGVGRPKLGIDDECRKRRESLRVTIIRLRNRLVEVYTRGPFREYGLQYYWLALMVKLEEYGEEQYKVGKFKFGKEFAEVLLSKDYEMFSRLQEANGDIEKIVEVIQEKWEPGNEG